MVQAGQLGCALTDTLSFHRVNHSPEHTYAWAHAAILPADSTSLSWPTPLYSLLAQCSTAHLTDHSKSAANMPKGRPVLPVVDLEDGEPETPEPAAPASRPHANALTVRQPQVQEKNLERAGSTDSNHPLLPPLSKEGKALVDEGSSMIQVCALMHRPRSSSQKYWRGYLELLPSGAATGAASAAASLCSHSSVLHVMLHPCNCQAAGI